MSKKMTPCEKLGYKVGDDFIVIEDSFKFRVGSIISLQEDDGTSSPFFTNEGVKDEYPSGVSCFLASIKKVAKLKPAKQALADAIHQNGGWKIGGFAVYGKLSGVCVFCDSKPRFDKFSHGWWVSSCGEEYDFKMKPFVNWHQCILSRDEYFTAYPEQVKVEVSNETEHKVEVEMKSESEVTINASDWHKNGELPPVGEVCLWIGRKENGDYRADLRTGDRVEVIAHYKPRSDGPMVAVFAYESRESIGRQTDQSIAKCFSPLRTEREKSIDEMMSVAAENWGNLQDCCERLYEYGYRKEVK